MTRVGVCSALSWHLPFQFCLATSQAVAVPAEAVPLHLLPEPAAALVGARPAPRAKRRPRAAAEPIGADPAGAAAGGQV